MKNENLSDGEMNIIDSSVQQIGKSESRLKGRRLYRRLPISTATGRADSVRAFRKLTKWTSHSLYLSTKASRIPREFIFCHYSDSRLIPQNQLPALIDTWCEPTPASPFSRPEPTQRTNSSAPCPEALPRRGTATAGAPSTAHSQQRRR